MGEDNYPKARGRDTLAIKISDYIGSDSRVLIKVQRTQLFVAALGQWLASRSLKLVRFLRVSKPGRCFKT